MFLFINYCSDMFRPRMLDIFTELVNKNVDVKTVHTGKTKSSLKMAKN